MYKRFLSLSIVFITIFGLSSAPVAAAFPNFPDINDFTKPPVVEEPPVEDPIITPAPPPEFEDPEEPIDVVQSPVEGYGAVSLSFDDGLLSAYTEALPILEEYGIRGTSYVYPEAQVEKEKGGGYEDFMSWDQIKSLQDDYGWEIGSHAYSHPHLTQIPKYQMRREIKVAYKQFKRRGINAAGFASPYGEYNDNVLNYVSRYHSYHRNAFGGAFNDLSTQNDYNLNAVEVAYDMTPDQVKTLIDEAVSDNKWLILYWHDLVPGDPTPFTYNIDDFREVVEYLAGQTTRVEPVRDIVEDWGNGENLVMNGDFEKGSGNEADGWIRNDTSKVRILRRFQGNAPLPFRNVLIRGSSSQIQISSQPIMVSDTKDYMLRFFSKLVQLKSGSANVWVSEFDDTGAYIGGQWLGGIFSTYVGTKYFKYSPQAGTDHIEIYFYAEADSNLKWYLDDVGMKIAK